MSLKTDLIRNILIVAQFVITIIWVVSYGAYTRFSNPDMTETRLFLTYWTIYIPNCIALILSYLLVAHGLKND